MSEKIKPEMISRGAAFRLMGLGAALGFAVPTVLTPSSDAEAETAGMERREERRSPRAA